VTDSTRLHLDAYGTGLGLWNLQFHKFQWTARFGYLNCAHFRHETPPELRGQCKASSFLTPDFYKVTHPVAAFPEEKIRASPGLARRSEH
jgi:hypothetical protein